MLASLSSCQKNLFLKQGRENNLPYTKLVLIRGNLGQLQVFLMVLAASIFASNTGSDWGHLLYVFPFSHVSFQLT